MSRLVCMCLRVRLDLEISWVLVLGVYTLDVSILLGESVDYWFPLEVAHHFWHLLQLALLLHHPLLFLDVVRVAVV